MHSPRVEFALSPANHAKQTEELGLDLKWDIKVLRYGVDPKWQRGERPEQHHGRGQTLGRLGSIGFPYLRTQLDAPEDSANETENACRNGDGLLGGHVSWEAQMLNTSMRLCRRDSQMPGRRAQITSIDRHLVLNAAESSMGGNMTWSLSWHRHKLRKRRRCRSSRKFRLSSLE